ncbi:MAG: hypothetical protein IKB93_12505 [Clostridia bacterium]|nr:hypothetical protein [Clostridia bacterium]
MLENIYTTKMSANKKQLQNRFSKIRSANSKISKMMSLAMAILVAVTMLCATVVLASVVNEAPEQFKIEVKHANTIIQLDNKPYVYDNTVYLPLRELMEKSELLGHENTYINWDDGKIEMVLIEKVKRPEYLEPKGEVDYLVYNYGIEIGKAEYTLNPGMEKEYQNRWNISNSKQMSHAPMLKDGVTYIPFEFVEYLINRSMQITDITCSAWDLAYNDKTDRKADYINDSIGIEYANHYKEFQYDIKGFDTAVTLDVNTKNKSSVSNAFFEAFSRKDYETMKQYCTDFCIKNHFMRMESPENAFVFGMSKAVMKNVSVPYTANEKETDFLNVVIECETPSILSSVGGERVIKVFFEKQVDGTYLIDDFAY